MFDFSSIVPKLSMDDYHYLLANDMMKVSDRGLYYIVLESFQLRGHLVNKGMTLPYKPGRERNEH